MTAQLLPGGESMTAFGPAPSESAAWITGTAEASPVFRIPEITGIPWETPRETAPISRVSSVIAPVGHTSAQPPHAWQTSANSLGFPPINASALKWQNSTHFRQPSHFCGSKAGTRVVTLVSTVCSGLKNRWPLGSSASQSMYTESPDTAARLTDTKGFPGAALAA